jgi:hypothetical protein
MSMRVEKGSLPHDESQNAEWTTLWQVAEVYLVSPLIQSIASMSLYVPTCATIA